MAAPPRAGCATQASGGRRTKTGQSRRRCARDFPPPPLARREDLQDPASLALLPGAPSRRSINDVAPDAAHLARLRAVRQSSVCLPARVARVVVGVEWGGGRPHGVPAYGARVAGSEVPDESSTCGLVRLGSVHGFGRPAVPVPGHRLPPVSPCRAARGGGVVSVAGVEREGPPVTDHGGQLASGIRGRL